MQAFMWPALLPWYKACWCWQEQRNTRRRGGRRGGEGAVAPHHHHRLSLSPFSLLLVRRRASPPVPSFVPLSLPIKSITLSSLSIDSPPAGSPATAVDRIMHQQTTTTTPTQLQTTTPPYPQNKIMRHQQQQQRQEEEAAAKATEDSRFVFDAGKPPPFRIGDVRAAVPAHCWRKSPLRSLSYVARDVAVVAGLAVAAAALDTWALWPIYWAAQGTMFWALFVLGHDWYARLLAFRVFSSASCCWFINIYIYIYIYRLLCLHKYIINAVGTGASLTAALSTARWGISSTPSSSSPTMDGMLLYIFISFYQPRKQIS